jgi:KUP system potassium uptake protein
MLMTTAILYRVMRVMWQWPVWAALGVFCAFMCVDLAFFTANLTKIADGGWIPLLVGALIFTVMTTWRAGTDAMRRRQVRDVLTIAQFVRQLRDHKILRVPGRAIFLTRLRGYIPPVIADHVRQMGSLYEETVALTVHFALRPRVSAKRRISCERLGEGFWHVSVHFGFIEIPDVAKALHSEKSRCPINPDDAIYISERDLVGQRRQKPRLSAWRRHLFGFLYRNSIHPADRFNIPAQNFVQITRQIEV